MGQYDAVKFILQICELIINTDVKFAVQIVGAMNFFGRNLLPDFHINPNTINLLIVILTGMAIAMTIVAFGVMIVSQ